MWFVGDFSRHTFIISPSVLASSFPTYRNFSKGASKICVSIFFTRLLHRPWPLLDIQGPNISFGTTHQVVNWRLQRLNEDLFEICMFDSTAISIHMLIQTRMILIQNSNAPGVTSVIIVGKCCWTKSSQNLFNKIYTGNVVEQNRLNKESIAPFQRSDVRVFADLFWSIRLVPLDFQRRINVEKYVGNSSYLHLRVSVQRFEPGGFIEPRRFRIIFP